jgi:RNA polymerase sigma factor (sigma-70 family)
MAVVGMEGSKFFRTGTALSSEAEFEVFFCESFQRVVGMVAVVTGDAGLAEDAAQEAFVRAYGRWSRVRGLQRPDAWVARVAMNLALDGRKKLRREAQLAPDLEGPVRDQVEEIWMRWNLGQLPPMQRAAIVLRYFEGLPVTEVARSMGRSTDTVKSHIRLGRRRLRGLLAGEVAL